MIKLFKKLLLLIITIFTLTNTNLSYGMTTDPETGRVEISTNHENLSKLINELSVKKLTNKKDFEGKTILFITLQEGFFDLAKKIIEKCLPDSEKKEINNDISNSINKDINKYTNDIIKDYVNIKDNYERTPIFYACKNSKLDIVKELIKLKAKTKIKDKFGKNIKYYANEEIKEILESNKIAENKNCTENNKPQDKEKVGANPETTNPIKTTNLLEKNIEKKPESKPETKLETDKKTKIETKPENSEIISTTKNKSTKISQTPKKHKKNDDKKAPNKTQNLDDDKFLEGLINKNNISNNLSAKEIKKNTLNNTLNNKSNNPSNSSSNKNLSSNPNLQQNLISNSQPSSNKINNQERQFSEKLVSGVLDICQKVTGGAINAEESRKDLENFYPKDLENYLINDGLVSGEDIETYLKKDKNFNTKEIEEKILEQDKKDQELLEEKNIYQEEQKEYENNNNQKNSNPDSISGTSGYTTTYNGNEQDKLCELYGSGKFEEADSLYNTIPSKEKIDKANIKDRSDNTPILIAVTKNDIPTIKKLFAMGAEVNTKNIFGQSPIFIALSMGDQNLINLLKKNGAKYDPKKLCDNLNQNPIFLSYITGNFENVKKLREMGFGGNINSENSRNETPLFNAFTNAKFEVASKLLKAKNYGEKENAKGNINMENKQYLTPLINAYLEARIEDANKLRFEATKFGLKENAKGNVFSKNSFGRSALFYTLAYGYKENTQTIENEMKKEKSILGKKSENNNIIDNEYDPIKDIMLNERDNYGRTTLHFACLLAHKKGVELIIDKFEKIKNKKSSIQDFINVKDQYDKTAMDYIFYLKRDDIISNQIEIANILESKGGISGINRK